MTQALALAEHLRAAGHRIVEVAVGLGPGWEIPDYFTEGIGAPIHRFRGPTHVMRDDRAGIDTAATTRTALRSLPAFVRSATDRIRRHRQAEIDLEVGFFDAVGGLARLLGSRTPRVAIGHHYLLFHPDAPRPPLGVGTLTALRLLTRLTGVGDRRLGLSFRALPDSGKAVRVVPPLLRSGLRTLEPSDEGHLLVYAVTPGIGDRVADWQRSRPEVAVRIFVAGGRGALATRPGPGCEVHDLDGEAFPLAMASCRGFAGSAGFEAVCEAHWLGKPVLAVPTEGQIEQSFNAADGARAGVLRAGGWDDLDDWWAGLRPPDPDRVRSFRDWVASSAERFVREIESTARETRAR